MSFSNFTSIFKISFLALFLFSNVFAADKIIHRVNGGNLASMDPHFMSGTWESVVAGDIFVGLTTEAADGKIIPGLASSWDISKDGKTYTFKLRKNAKWSDGSKISAQDCEFSFKRALNPKNASKYAFILYPIKNAQKINKGELDISKLGVKALDDDTLEIQLENVFPAFLGLLVHYQAYILPKKAIQKYNKDWTKKENILLSGAFKLKSWTPNDKIVLTKNQMFYDAQNVKLDGVVYHIIENDNSALKRYQAGEIHIANNIPSGQFKALRKKFKDELKVAPYLGIYYYGINTNKIKDIRVRKALSMAINRDVITKKVLGEGQESSYTFVPKNIGNYVPFDKQPKLEFSQNSHKDNVKEAKRLIKEAGYSKSNPLKIEIKYNTSEGHKKIAIAIASMWKKIGVKTTLFNQEVKVHYENLNNNDFEVARAGWIGDYNDPQNFIDLYLDNDYNYSRYIDKNLIALVKEAQSTVDLDKRALLLAKAEKLALDGHSKIPLYYYVSKHLVSKKVIGWEDNIQDIHRTRWLDLK